MNGEEYVVYTYNEMLFGLKKKEILSFVTTWMNLKGVMLSEINQTEKDKLSCLYVKSKKLNS